MPQRPFRPSRFWFGEVFGREFTIPTGVLDLTSALLVRDNAIKLSTGSDTSICGNLHAKLVTADLNFAQL